MSRSPILLTSYLLRFPTLAAGVTAPTELGCASAVFSTGAAGALLASGPLESTGGVAPCASAICAPHISSPIAHQCAKLLRTALILQLRLWGFTTCDAKRTGCGMT